jgi:hypothetical protein
MGFMRSDLYKHLLIFVVGDCEWAGHCKTDSCLVWSNITSAQVQAAYKKACALNNIDLGAECDEHNRLSGSFVQTLTDLGIQHPMLDKYKQYTQSYVPSNVLKVSPLDYMELYLRIAGLVEPKLQWEYTDVSYNFIKGYGLYTYE